MDFIQSIINRWPAIVTGTYEHIQLTAVSLFIAVLIAVPLGIILTRNRRYSDAVIGITAVFQTIPSLALLGFMIPILGIGFTPSIVALTIYGLLPILRNTYTGLTGVDKAAVEAGVGMGMTSRQILFMIELPLALNIIMAGIRTSTVLIIGVATLAALIGGGGLGDLIFRGIAMANSAIILAGAIPAAILAIIFDSLLKWGEFRVTPEGLKK
ncbi:osmoprotectant transport system permease protein [Desulfitispora alkaliphila]|uniref:ABC transporter permease n=1 Tax=Desulfitispora alkaliphila TaxID=622674 RepID=UPI003D251B83